MCARIVPKGRAAFVPAATTTYTLSGGATLFRATTFLDVPREVAEDAVR